MKNTLKTLAVGAAMILPFASFAGESKTAVQPVKTETTTTVAKTETKASTQEWTLEGAKSDNTAEIIKLAKEAGASNASFNAKNNKLTVSGANFNKEQFTSSLSTSLPTVSVKN